ncbi:MAG: glycosyl hydrolase family 8 [Paludibacteraceae bacterium]|nr:glycosyl hydrolase family 8 [Paludibacteraceae bacterium]
MKKSLLVAVSTAALSFLSASAQEIATWEDWKKAAVTFTFDDAAREYNTDAFAADALSKKGFVGTFYMVTGWANGLWSKYQEFAKNGHEIGSHTDSHTSQDSELASSKNTINNNIRNQECITIAYPNCNVPTESQVLANYIGGRICGGQINSKSPSNFARLDCIICGTQGINSTNQFTSKIDQAKGMGGWVVFLIHGISGMEASGSYSPTDQRAFTGTLDYLSQNESSYWVTSFRNACMYIKERDNSTLKKVGGDSSSDTYSLTLNTQLSNNKICKWNYPLSIRVPMQDGWTNIKVTQNDQEIESEVSGGYVYFKAVPNGGDIVVGSGAPAVPDPVFSFKDPSAAQSWCKDSSYTISWTMDGDTNGKDFTLNWSTGSSADEIDVNDVSASSEWATENGDFSWSVNNILSNDGSHGESQRWGSVSGKNEYVVFTFSSVQTVGGVKIDEFTKYGNVAEFEIQYDDNGSWKTAYKGTTIGEDFEATFPPVSSKKMRFFINEAGDGANINYVAFTGVAGMELKSGITSSGSFVWKPNTTGNGTLTITKSNGKTIATSAAIKIADCGGGSVNPGETPGTIASGSFFDENGAYFGPTCYNGEMGTGAFYTGDYTSPFKTILGKTDTEIQKKLDQMWDHYFVGSNKVYFDKNDGTAYVFDTGSNDVRSEGMSYGMMICVQTDHKSEFDKLWAFAKKHMLHTSGQWQGYFKWQCNPDGSAQDANCAPDGEMYFTTALMLAAHRWGQKSYMDDAQYCLKNFWKNGTGSLFNEQHNVITFQPYNCSDFSDPSYDLPAFVDLFAMWSETNNSRWATAATATRNHLYQSCNTQSGLFSDYNNFDGTPKQVDYNGNAHKYMYDAMRCAMNYGMDYYLFGKDAKRQTEMAKRIIDFFEKDGYQHARFNWDGSGAAETYTLGETGANAVACYALMDEPSYASKVKTNLTKAWNAGLATGQYRYYDGLVHYLAMLHLTGSFKIWKPAPSIEEKTVEGGEYQGVTYTETTTLTAFEDCQLYNVTVKPADGDFSTIHELNNVSGKVGIAPNPAKEFFVVVCNEEISAIDLIGIDGQLVMSDHSGNSRIETADIPAGAYIVRVALKNGGNAEYLRLVIAK